jgi:hypothetical protein
MALKDMLFSGEVIRLRSQLLSLSIYAMNNIVLLIVDNTYMYETDLKEVPPSTCFKIGAIAPLQCIIIDVKQTQSAAHFLSHFKYILKFVYKTFPCFIFS